MIMVPVSTTYAEFMQRLKEKFAFRGSAKCKIRDEDGDGMITLQDDEDLEIAVSTSKKNARKERAEHGKMEVRILFRFVRPKTVMLTACLLGLGFRNVIDMGEFGFS